jgi:hypothetical protein
MWGHISRCKILLSLQKQSCFNRQLFPLPWPWLWQPIFAHSADSSMLQTGSRTMLKAGYLLSCWEPREVLF